MAAILKSSAQTVAARPARQAVKASAVLKASVKATPAVSTGAANQMMVWQPINNKWVLQSGRGF